MFRFGFHARGKGNRAWSSEEEAILKHQQSFGLEYRAVVAVGSVHILYLGLRNEYWELGASRMELNVGGASFPWFYQKPEKN
jgi:hypothetical protein